MRTLYFCPVISLFFLLFYSSPNLSGRRLDFYHTSTHGMALSEMCCTQLAGSAGLKRSPKIRHLGTIAQLCLAISLQLRHVSTIGKNLLNSNTSPTSSCNMLNFGPLASEIVSLVCGTPANFNGFRVLVTLMHGTLVMGVSQTLRR